MRVRKWTVVLFAGALMVSVGASPAAEADAKADRAEASRIVAGGVKDGGALLSAGKPAEARARYRTAAEAAAARAGTESDAGRTLAKALADAEAMPDDAAAAERLAGGLREAAVALDFKPRMEAPLPEGWPPPGPVGEVAVKDYPTYRAARTPMREAGQNGAFRTLFDHIRAKDIPMTAPVEMVYGREKDAKPDARRGPAVAPMSMAFLYRTTDVGKPGGDGPVEVLDVPRMTVVSIGVRGVYTDERMAEALAVLDRWLAKNAAAYATDGPPRYLGYNSPFNLPWMMYGEVQVPVKQVAP